MGPYPGAYPHKNSGVGVASLVTAIIGLVVELGSLGFGIAWVFRSNLAGASQATINQSMAQQPSMVMASLGIVGGMFVLFVAAVLGLVSLFQSQRKKTAGVVGLLLSGIVLLMLLGLMVTGMMR